MNVDADRRLEKARRLLPWCQVRRATDGTVRTVEVPSQTVWEATHIVAVLGKPASAWHEWRCDCEFAQIHTPGRDGVRACVHLEAARLAMMTGVGERCEDCGGSAVLDGVCHECGAVQELAKVSP